MPLWASWIIIPVLSGLIGWFTNWLAVKMLFRPRLTKVFLGVHFQGVIPKRRGEIAQVIGQTIEKELLTHGDLKAALLKIDMRETFKPILEEKINQLVSQKIAALNPMMMALIPNAMIEKIKTAMLEEILNSLPEMVEKISDAFVNKIAISDLVIQNINKFDLVRLENMIVEASHKEFKFIEILGGVVGLLIGVLQMAIMSFWK